MIPGSVHIDAYQGLFPLYFASRGLSLTEISALGALYPAVRARRNSAPERCPTGVAEMDSLRAGCLCKA